MARIQITVRNSTSNDYIVHIEDLFGGGPREVSESPFAIAAGESENISEINAGADGHGTVAYRCEGGPSLSNIDVTNESTVTI